MSPTPSQCPICTFDYVIGREPLVPPCGHDTCTECTQRMLASTAPYCFVCRERFPSSIKDFTPVFSLINSDKPASGPAWRRPPTTRLGKMGAFVADGISQKDAWKAVAVCLLLTFGAFVIWLGDNAHKLAESEWQITIERGTPLYKRTGRIDDMTDDEKTNALEAVGDNVERWASMKDNSFLCKLVEVARSDNRDDMEHEVLKAHRTEPCLPQHRDRTSQVAIGRTRATYVLCYAF